MKENKFLFHCSLALLIVIQLTVVGYLKLSLFEKSFVTSDGALFANMLWNTNFTDMFLYTHYNDHRWGIQTYLADHFSPTLLLVAPVYHLLPFPQTLLIIQTLMPGIACALIYWSGMKIIKNQPLSFLIAATYLLAPFTILGTLDDFYGFHHDSLMPPLILLTFIFLIEKKTLHYLILLILTLGLKENLPFLGILLGIEISLYGLLKRDKYFKKLGVLTLLLAIAFSVIGLWLVPNLTDLPHQYTLRMENSLSIGNLINSTTLLHWASVIFIFFPALMAPEVLVLIIPDLIALLLLDYPPYDWHIFSPITVITIACIVGMARLLRMSEEHRYAIKEKGFIGLIPISWNKNISKICWLRPSLIFILIFTPFLVGTIYLLYPAPQNVFFTGQEIHKVIQSFLQGLFITGVIIIISITGNWLKQWVYDYKLLAAVSLLPMIIAISYGLQILYKEATIIKEIAVRVSQSDVNAVADLIPPESRLAVTSNLLIHFTNRTHLLWPGDHHAEYILANGFDLSYQDVKYNLSYQDVKYILELRKMLESGHAEIVTSSGNIILLRRTDLH